jgi:hypothetical protein
MRRALTVLGVGLIAGLVLLSFATWGPALIGGWDAAALTFLLTTWPIITRGQAPQAAGRGVAVHSRTPAVDQNRPGASANSPVDGPPDRGRQRDQHGLGPFAAHAQHPVAVFFAEVADIGAGGLEDPQAQQAEHGYQREVARVWGLPRCGEQCLELQMGEPKSW